MTAADSVESQIFDLLRTTVHGKAVLSLVRTQHLKTFQPQSNTSINSQKLFEGQLTIPCRPLTVCSHRFHNGFFFLYNRRENYYLQCCAGHAMQTIRPMTNVFIPKHPILENVCVSSTYHAQFRCRKTHRMLCWLLCSDYG